TRTPHVEIPHIMERPMRLLVPIGRVPTTRARSPDVVATVGDDLGLWQVCGCGDPGAWVGAVLTWTEHRVALLTQRFRPELYNKRLLGAIRCSRYSLRFMAISTCQRHRYRAMIVWGESTTGANVVQTNTQPAKKRLSA